MKCQYCKTREANIQIYQQIGQQAGQGINICSVCAEQKGLNVGNAFSFLANATESLINWNQLFPTGLGPSGSHLSDETLPTCPDCKSTLEDLKMTGRLGCANCYTTFKNHLEPVFNRTQISSQHKGRKRGESSLQQSIQKASPIAFEKDNLIAPHDASGKEGTLSKSSEAFLADTLASLEVSLTEAIAKENYKEAIILRDKIKALKNQT